MKFFFPPNNGLTILPFGWLCVTYIIERMYDSVTRTLDFVAHLWYKLGTNSISKDLLNAGVVLMPQEFDDPVEVALIYLLYRQAGAGSTDPVMAYDQEEGRDAYSE